VFEWFASKHHVHVGPIVYTNSEVLFPWRHQWTSNWCVHW